MEEVCEQEADELKRGRDHAVPEEGEEGTDWHAVDVNLIKTTETGG